jgi:hypothetical protein
MAVLSSKASTSLCLITILFPIREAFNSPEEIRLSSLPRLNPKRRHALSGEWANGGQFSSTLASDTGFSFDDGVGQNTLANHIT